MNREELLLKFAVSFAAKVAANLVTDEIKRRREEKEEAPNPRATARHMRKEA